jgi:hypothetical protein
MPVLEFQSITIISNRLFYLLTDWLILKRSNDNTFAFIERSIFFQVIWSIFFFVCSIFKFDKTKIFRGECYLITTLSINKYEWILFRSFILPLIAYFLFSLFPSSPPSSQSINTCTQTQYASVFLFVKLDLYWTHMVQHTFETISLKHLILFLFPSVFECIIIINLTKKKTIYSEFFSIGICLTTNMKKLDWNC